MKRFLFIALMVCAGMAQGQEKADVVFKVSSFFNDYKGYVPDVNARVYLYKDTGKTLAPPSPGSYDMGWLLDGRDTVFADYKGRIDVDGRAEFTGVPYGRYLAVVDSKLRFMHSKKMVAVDQPKVTLVKNFEPRDEFNEKGQEWE